MKNINCKHQLDYQEEKCATCSGLEVCQVSPCRKIEFFMPMGKVPTVTHQEKQVSVVKGKPVFYEPEKLKDVRGKLMANLAKHAPGVKMTGPLQLITKWCFPRGKHADGAYKTTKPDTDNLQKLLKDCMTNSGFWRDDAQVASEVIEKFWAEIPGIYVSVVEISEK